MRGALLLLLTSSIASAAYLAADNHEVSTNVSTLQAAESLSVTFTVTHIGGMSSSETLTLNKPNKVRLESDAKLVVADGTTIHELDKKANTYREMPEDGNLAALLQGDEAWVWSAFSDKDFAKALKSASTGSERSIGGHKVTEVSVSTAKGARTLFFDAKLGIFRGMSLQEDTAAGPDNIVVLAQEVKTSTSDASPDLFAFNPGSAKKAEDIASMTLTYKDIRPILEGNCTSCHDAIEKRAGIDLSSYSAIMGENIVTAGDPDSSQMIRMIRSGKMPPRGGLRKDLTDKLVKWVKDGAKEQ